MRELVGQPELANAKATPEFEWHKSSKRLPGSVNSAATKAKAEQIVKAVRGVKSVDNQIVVLA